MCLITDQKTPIIAETDIVVYKLMETRLRSYFQFFQYELDTLFETKIEKTKHIWMACCGIDRLYLEEKYKVDRVDDLRLLSKFDLVCLERGFHSCDTLDLAERLAGDRNPLLEYYECIIPKGSEYYKDGVGFIISNKIIIKNYITRNLDVIAKAKKKTK